MTIKKAEANFNAANVQSSALAAALQSMAYFDPNPEQMAAVGRLYLAALRTTGNEFKKMEITKRGADIPQEWVDANQDLADLRDAFDEEFERCSGCKRLTRKKYTCAHCGKDDEG